MENIFVEIHKSSDNFCCGWGCKDFGVIMVTSDSIEKLKLDFIESLTSHVEDMLLNGEYVPEFLKLKDYKINFRVL
jgi:hypothetical protein